MYPTFALRWPCEPRHHVTLLSLVLVPETPSINHLNIQNIRPSLIDGSAPLINASLIIIRNKSKEQEVVAKSNDDVSTET